jgi:hypothetical protein
MPLEKTKLPHGWNLERTPETYGQRKKKSKENIQNVFDCDGDQSLTSSTLWMCLLTD